MKRCEVCGSVEEIEENRNGDEADSICYTCVKIVKMTVNMILLILKNKGKTKG